MFRIMQSELLKMRHTFSIKLLFVAPLITVLIGTLLSGRFTQLSSYNWWYTIILPTIVAMWSANTISCEKKTNMQNVICIPIAFEKIWLGKVFVLATILFGTNVILWLLTTIAGIMTETTVSPINGLIGCMLLFVSYLWQIPLVMLLANFIGYLPTIIGSVLANTILFTMGAEKRLFFLNPFAIPSRIVCPFFKIHPNGIPIEDGSSLLTNTNVMAAMGISILIAAVFLVISSKLFCKEGRSYE